MAGNNTKRTFRKKNVIPIATAGVLLVALTAYMFSYPPKPEYFAEEVSRGEYMKKFVFEKDNAFHDYLIATRLHQEPKGDLRGEISYLIRKVRELEKVTEVGDGLEAYVKRNQPAVDMIMLGIEKSKCMVPKIYGLNEFLPYMTPLREIAYIMIAQAKLTELEGDYQRACEEYLNVMRFAQDISKNGMIMHGLFSIETGSLALKAMRLGLENLNDKTLEVVVNELKEIDDTQVPLSETFKTEYDCRSKEFKYLRRNRGNYYHRLNIGSYERSIFRFNAKWLSVLFTRRRLMRDLKDRLDRAIEVADTPLNENELLESERLKHSALTIFLPSVERIKLRYAYFLVELRGTRLRAAVELYQKRLDQLPADLEDLVDAGIIDEVPIDSFGGDKFKYVNNKIYSIGPDFHDDKAVKEYNRYKIRPFVQNQPKDVKEIIYNPGPNFDKFIAAMEYNRREKEKDGDIIF